LSVASSVDETVNTLWCYRKSELQEGGLKTESTLTSQDVGKIATKLQQLQQTRAFRTRQYSDAAISARSANISMFTKGNHKIPTSKVDSFLKFLFVISLTPTSYLQPEI
jgi:hypothetical protein